MSLSTDKMFTRIVLLFLLSLGFGSGTYWSSLQTLEDGENLARSAFSHLDYAVRSRDDMGIVDWAKGMEASPRVQAFRFSVGGKNISSGGNERLLSKAQDPSHLLTGFEFFSEDLPAAKGTLELALRPSYPPWYGGVWTCLFILTAWFSSARLASAQRSTGPLRPDPESADLPVRSHGPSRVPQDLPSHLLVLDPKFNVIAFGEQVPHILGVEAHTLRGSHLLDLEPDPELVQRIENRVEKVHNGFSRRHSGWTVSLEFPREGTLILFHPPSSSAKPENP